jgi:hypothetical protein
MSFNHLFLSLRLPIFMPISSITLLKTSKSNQTMIALIQKLTLSVKEVNHSHCLVNY